MRVVLVLEVCCAFLWPVHFMMLLLLLSSFGALLFAGPKETELRHKSLMQLTTQ